MHARVHFGGGGLHAQVGALRCAQKFLVFCGIVACERPCMLVMCLMVRGGRGRTEITHERPGELQK